MSHRDKGAAKPLKEKLDELKRAKAQEGLVVEWASLHREALLENWERARRGEPLRPIPPLE